MRWFERHLQKVLIEAGEEGLRINNIVLNVCNMEPALFSSPHPYEDAWKEIYRFLRYEASKPQSPYRYVQDRATGKTKRGYFCMNSAQAEELQKELWNFDR